jgi:hypothetical protein
MPPTLLQFISDNRDPLTAGLIGGVVLMLLAQIVVLSKLGRLTRLYTRLTKNTSGGNLEEILHDYMGTVEQTSRRMDALEKRADAIAEDQKRCLQKVGIIRFDAFEEVGGEQSFALVVLNAEETGIALSSVYSRQDVRVYAKAIRDGQPSHPLTREEQEAMSKANGKK